MKFFEYEYETFDGETKTLKLRLVSSDMKTIEKRAGVKLLDFVGDYSITTISNLLMFMNRPAIPNFSEKDADKLYDELIDAGLTLEDVYQNVIMETLVVSFAPLFPKGSFNISTSISSPFFIFFALSSSL